MITSPARFFHDLAVQKQDKQSHSSFNSPEHNERSLASRRG